ncbi:CLUMA_CG019913, isoform A [Clunio marinus]|uniref:CLUMA_CG019913, isoform A n=1 Tax=Clunio marinus TaxID=568069 RepID=A0A1J1J3E1_9DIPT|nr:CLUMA_CG019913, isoform A [Clunio marinus]
MAKQASAIGYQKNILLIFDITLNTCDDQNSAMKQLNSFSSHQNSVQHFVFRKSFLRHRINSHEY